MPDTTTTLPQCRQAIGAPQRNAIIDETGSYTYADLWGAATAVAGSLLGEQQDLQEARVAFLVAPGFDFVATLWGIWLAGGIAVPLCLAHPRPELEYTICDSDAAILVADAAHLPSLQAIGRETGRQVRSVHELRLGSNRGLPQIDPSRRMLILYTSGTTSKPKGVVLTQRNLTAQISTLITAWGWQADDHILHVLPLHHTHGLINVLCCALWAGAACEMLPKFEPNRVWQQFMTRPLTLFMAVPTIYVKLIQAWEKAGPALQSKMSAACSKFRLMVSGSAALPAAVFNRWQEITGHLLLERYGMTEIGMALSNPVHGERRPGTVGRPLPGVLVRLVDEAGRLLEREGEIGEIQISGDTVFLEYWHRPEATRAAFTEDGWFRTGDTGCMEEGYYRILGRTSVDIIKSGGYKISALQIEEVLREHPAVAECAIVGMPHPEWGELICAALVLREGCRLGDDALRSWARERLAPYKLPRRIAFVESLPRNAMGKVLKPEIKKLFY